MWVLALLALGCSRPDPLEGLPSLPFERSGIPVLALDRLPGRYTLPTGSVGDLAEARRPLVGFTAVRDSRNVWKADLPFELPAKGPTKARPADLVVRRGEVEIPWDGSLHRADAATGAWRLDDGKIHLVAEAAPADGEISVETTTFARRLDRLQLSKSGLEPEAFVRFAHLAPEKTREGLLLPAPAVAEFDVTLPAGATFEAGLMIVPPPLQTSLSDGARLIVSVLVGAEEHALTDVYAPSPGAEPAPLSLDLSAWAGQSVTVRLVTDPGAESLHDWVFLASPVIRGAPRAQPRRVVVLAIDTLRPDHLGTYGYTKATSPEIDALGGASSVFDAAWAPAPRTRPSFRTATTGRWPLEAVGATNIGEVFDAAGFATAGIVANVHLNPRFDFHRGFDLWWLDTSAKADDQVDRALGWLQENRLRDTYLFLHLMDPHLPYNAPGSWRDTHVTVTDPTLPSSFNRWQAYAWQRKGTLTDARKQHITGLYDSEIAWTSSQVGRFVEGLDGLGGDTLIVFHTDHGEELWDHDGYEHNHTLYEEVVRAGLFFRVPGAAPSREQVPASLADIGPTLYDYAGITEHPPVDGISLRPWIEGDAPTPDRPLPLGYLRYDRERWGVVADGHKYVLWTEDGREELYDLATDPGEKNDLSEVQDLAPWRSALGEAHGIPVGPGWRIEVDVQPGSAPITVQLPEACVAAGVIDPESIAKRPVNQEWGEIPPKLPADVGAVALADDKRSFVFTPGSDPSGLLYVMFERSLPPGARLVRDGRALAFSRTSTARTLWTQGQERIDVRRGTIVVPPLDEAQRMAEIAAKHGDAAAGDLELLRSLGYIGDDQ